MTTQTNSISEESQIRDVIDAWLAAQRTKDVDRLMSLYADDITAFNVRPPYQTKGADAWRVVWEDGFSHFPSTFDIEIADLKIYASGDMAFSYFLFHFTDLEPGHPANQTWLRATVGYTKQDGRCLIQHEHFSIPYSPHTSEPEHILEP